MYSHRKQFPVAGKHFLWNFLLYDKIPITWRVLPKKKFLSENNISIFKVIVYIKFLSSDIYFCQRKIIPVTSFMSFHVTNNFSVTRNCPVTGQITTIQFKGIIPKIPFTGKVMKFSNRKNSSHRRNSFHRKNSYNLKVFIVSRK